MSTTRSARAPGASAPRVASPSTAAGAVDAGVRPPRPACTPRTPGGCGAPRPWARRSRPGCRRPAAPRLRRGRRAGPAALTASVTTVSRSPRARWARATAVGSTWTPSAISPTRIRSSVRATPGSPGLAVVERGHAVEEVGDPASAGVDAGGGLRRGRRRVPQRHHDPPLDQGGDQLEGARQLRGQRHQGDPADPRPAAASTASGARSSSSGWAPRAAGPGTGPPGGARGAPRPASRPAGPRPAAARAASTAPTGAVTTVGSQAVTPQRGSSAASSHSRSGDGSRRSRARRCTAGR